MAVAVVTAIFRDGNQETPRASIELKFVTEALPNSAMKVMKLQTPRARMLTVKLFSRLGDPFNAYLVRFELPRTSQKAHEPPFIAAFAAEHVQKLVRSARVEMGEYHLTLINSAPAGSLHLPSLNIFCRLDP